MTWPVLIHEAFADEIGRLDVPVMIELRAMVELLRQFGPRLSRPYADTLKGSRHANMKELRFRAADGAWRVAFDPKRNAVLLVAGDKSGTSQVRFYRRLIETADRRFDDHLRQA